MAQVIADFERDWTDMLRAELQRNRYRVGPNEPPNQIGIKYFNVLKRRVPQGPRTVHVARGFTCTLELQGAWASMRDKIKRGEDLTPHLSRLLGKDFNDRLLNDWGIHHFHVGSAPADDGFMSRTRSVLFARLTMDAFFAIGVRQHDSCSDRDLMEALHENWPESIRQYRFDGIDAIEADATRDEICQLRVAGASVSLRMPDGTLYFPVGGGYATNGTSLQAVAASDAWLNQVRALERHLREHVEELVIPFKEAGHPITPPYEFRLDVSNGSFRAVEKRAGCAITFDQNVAAGLATAGPAPGSGTRE